MNDLREYYYRKILNQTVDIFLMEKITGAMKIENSYIDIILMRSFKSHFYLFEPLEIFGSGSAETKRFIKIKEVINKFDTSEYNDEIRVFIKDYKVDMEDINSKTLKTLVSYISNNKY